MEPHGVGGGPGSADDAADRRPDLNAQLYGGRRWEGPPTLLRPVAWFWNDVVSRIYDRRRARRSVEEGTRDRQIQRRKDIGREIARQREHRRPR